ncbi:MAG: helix-turn-helix transcriptional regulator [Candidatus Omnitrophica bacterium]|jgi:transcriptional regulator with XRE-family HTH domain|nr:helix-turn-helix transcriptional regulator [Candidatus Omnitrophota bacterium]MDD5081072.1 helix-turn-helix transcriptional regulator [Candidatus Omnitrophota bacterium]
MEINIKLKLANKIKALRQKKGITQEKLANLSDIDYKYIQKIEGKSPPNIKIETIERISKALHIHISELFDF